LTAEVIKHDFVARINWRQLIGLLVNYAVVPVTWKSSNNVGKFIIVCRKPIFYLFYLEHLVAYSARKSCTHIETQKHDARDILQAVKLGYSAITYITPKKIKTQKQAMN